LTSSWSATYFKTKVCMFYNGFGKSVCSIMVLVILSDLLNLLLRFCFVGEVTLSIMASTGNPSSKIRTRFAGQLISSSMSSGLALAKAAAFSASYSYDTVGRSGSKHF